MTSLIPIGPIVSHGKRFGNPNIKNWEKDMNKGNNYNGYSVKWVYGYIKSCITLAKNPIVWPDVLKVTAAKFFLWIKFVQDTRRNNHATTMPSLVLIGPVGSEEKQGIDFQP